MADEAIGVFVGASFPRMVGSSKETRYRGLRLNVLIAMELSAIVKGYGDKLTLVLLDGLYTGLSDQDRGPGGDFLDNNEASCPFDEGDDAVMTIATDDGIAFPVADYMAGFHDLRALGDMALAAQNTSGIIGIVAFAPSFRHYS